MKYYFILLFLLIFNTPIKDTPKIDVELQPYVKEFLKEAEHWRVPTDHYECIKGIYYVDRIPNLNSKDSTVGEYLPSIETIYIKRISKDPRFIRLVVWHELSHAILNLDHETHCISIMNPNLNPYFIDVYADQWNFLVQDIFIQAIKLDNYRIHNTK